MNIDLNTSLGIVEENDAGTLVVYRNDFPVEVWNECAEQLYRIPGVGKEYTLEDVYYMLRADHATLWAYYESTRLRMVMLTTFANYPRIRYLHIMGLAGGQLKRFVRFMPVLHRFMQLNDCAEVTARVRPQVAKLLARYGFVTSHTIVTLPTAEKANETIH